MATQLGGLRIDAYFFGIERINDCYIAFVEKDKAKKCVKLETVSVEILLRQKKNSLSWFRNINLILTISQNLTFTHWGYFPQWEIFPF